MGYKVQVGVSNKHVHLSQEAVEYFFGKGYELQSVKDLVQPGQFATNDRVDVVGPKGTIKNLRVLGPIRKETQVELAKTDARGIGIDVPVRESGKLDGTPGCTLIANGKELVLDHGVIAALRHVHLSLEEAEEAGVKDGDMVSVKVGGERGLVFDNVLIRAKSNFKAEAHFDTDEANAAGLGNNDMCEIIKYEVK